MLPVLTVKRLFHAYVLLFVFVLPNSINVVVSMNRKYRNLKLVRLKTQRKMQDGNIEENTLKFKKIIL